MTPPAVAENYLESARKLFRYAKELGDKALAQLEPPDFHWRASGESNSIAALIRHVSGGMLSRWTGFLTTDGEKPWRDRDSEFVERAEETASLLRRWEEGWACLFAAVDPLQPEDLQRIVYIRNEGHTVLEAINRQLAHVSYHTGQIVAAAKAIRSADFHTLSIPRGGTADYNKEKFAAEKSRKHFV